MLMHAGISTSPRPIKCIVVYLCAQQFLKAKIIVFCQCMLFWSSGFIVKLWLLLNDYNITRKLRTYSKREDTKQENVHNYLPLCCLPWIH